VSFRSAAAIRAATIPVRHPFVIASARTDSDLEAAFATFSQQRVGALLVSNGAFFSRRVEKLAALGARHALPAIFPFREYALAGGLMSYGSSVGYLYHQAGIYAGPGNTQDSFSAIPKRRSAKATISNAPVRVNRPNFCPATAPLRPCSGHTMMACCIQRSCPGKWCNWRWVTAFTGVGRAGQLAIAGRLTAGSSLNGAMVSRVM
jgi:hypothetical protein